MPGPPGDRREADRRRSAVAGPRRAVYHPVSYTHLTLPIFDGYDNDRLRTIGQTVFDLFTEEDGLDALFGLLRDALPDLLRETAYALCCDVAAADGHAFQAELQYLLELRHELGVDRLHAAAIERGSAARHRRLPAGD